MTTEEENARLVAYQKWADRETKDTRTVDQVPASTARAMARGAFLTGWRAAMEYAERQGSFG